MFQVITIQATADRGHILRHAIHATGQLMPLRELELPVDEIVAHRLLSLHHPDAVLVDLSGGEQSALAAYLLHRQSPQTPIVGIGGELEVREAVAEFGVHAFTSERPEPGELLSAVGAALHESCGKIEENLLTFLPAKAGSGCTTVVMNTAVALARGGRRVVVVEADLRSGVMSELLDRRVRHPLQSLLADSSGIDAFRVENCVVKAYGVAWLLSNRSIEARQPCWYDYFRLLEAVRQRYDHVLVDLPELVNAATVEFVRRSRQVYAVCTPEFPSLRLCAQRLKELAHWCVPDERTALVVNRWHPHDMSPSRVSDVIGRPVAQVLPNNYQAAHQAVKGGSPVEAGSKLGQAFTQFAGRVVGREEAPASPGLAGRLKAVLARV